MADDRKAMDQLQNKVDSKKQEERRNDRSRPKNVATWRTEKPPVLNNATYEDDPPDKKPINKRVIALLSLVLVLGGALMLIFNQESVSSAYDYLTGDYSWQRAHHADEEMYQLADGNQVQASVTIEVEERGQIRELSNRKEIVQRVIQDAFMTVNAPEVRSNEGKDRIVDEISETINQDVEGVEVKDVYFRSILAPLTN